jgi:serine O-acetyltransferase
VGLRLPCRALTGSGPQPTEALQIESDAFWRAIREHHPRLRVAVPEDARVTAMHRGERHEFRSRSDAIGQILRLMWVSDAFLGQVLYRIKARGQALGIPVLPRLAHRLAIITAQIAIGDPVVVEPGVYIVHGQVVADGLVEIGAGTVISPFVTIGLRAADVRGPVIEEGVSIGTGAKLIGPVRVGRHATIGANAVVVDDVAPGTTVVGAPARATEYTAVPPDC